MTRTEIDKKYRMMCDYHTHTKYSHGLLMYNHGKGSIYENVEAAHNLGIQEIAITDHGPGHQFYGIDLNKLPLMRKDIWDARQTFPDVKVYLGVEANIIDTPNGLDVDKDYFDRFDFVIAGYHFGVSKGHMIGNKLSSVPGFPSGGERRLKVLNTDMAVRAICDNNIKIITHPGDKGPFDMDEICKACEANDTLMEINTRHKHLTVDEIRIAAKYDVSFIIDSDAHKPSEVGNFQDGVLRAMEAGLDINRIVNVEERQ